MELKRVIKLLKELPADSGLDYEENWDDSPRAKQWRLDAIEALSVAVKVLQEGNTVGTLNINGKEYKITE